jgi:hypothetical protein
MKRPILLTYQWLIAVSDTATGALLIIAPEFTLRMMGLHVALDALPYISFIGAFVLSVGLACLYGAVILSRRGSVRMLEAVWFFTGLTRASVAVFVFSQILGQTLAPGWLTVAASDGACVLIQAIGLRRRWLRNGAR